MPEPIAGATGPIAATPPIQWGGRLLSWLILAGIITLLGLLIWPGIRRSPEAAYRVRCKNNLKRIATALHSYHDHYGVFPPACTVDSGGRPLHSWRTLILPFLDQQTLYDSIDLAKPWSDLANSQAATTSPSVFQCPLARDLGNRTTYLACTGPNAVFDVKDSRRLEDVVDGASNTLMVIEVPLNRAVPWMSPHDADEHDVVDSGPMYESIHTGGSHAAKVDGAILYLPAAASPSVRRALFTIAGGEKIGEP